MHLDRPVIRVAVDWNILLYRIISCRTPDSPPTAWVCGVLCHLSARLGCLGLLRCCNYELLNHQFPGAEIQQKKPIISSFLYDNWIRRFIFLINNWMMRPWIRRFTIIISAWWLQTSSKFTWEEVKTSTGKLGKWSTPKRVRIRPKHSAPSLSRDRRIKMHKSINDPQAKNGHQTF